MEVDLLERALREYVGSRTLFTISAYRYMMENVPTNCVLSPFSAESYLTSIRLGARGQTAEEIRIRFGHLPCDNKTTSDAINKVLWILIARTYHRLELAVKIYVSQNYEVKQNFRRLLVNDFLTRVENVDFTQQCASAMNSWVQDEISNVFQKEISDDMLTPTTKMVVVNGANFKGRWNIPFTKQRTLMQFTVNEQESIAVESMANKWRHCYCHSESLKAKIIDIDLESRNNDCSLVLIIPDEVNGLAGIEENISSVFNLDLQQFEQKTIALVLPIFKIETMIDFRDIFNRAGIHQVFDEDEADLTGISDGQGLHLNNFFQKVVFDLNEKGINADNSLVNSGRALTVPDFHAATCASNTTCVKADRPFAFYIKLRNVIVMTGRFLNPISEI